MARTLIVSDRQNSFFTSNNIKVGTQIPTEGTYSKGDIVVNIGNNTANEAMWICVESGTPGTWEVVGAGAGGGGGSLIAINESVFVNEPVIEVSLGSLVGKISNSDKLLVHYNSTHLMEGVDYEINSDGTKIVKLTEGSWNESGEDGALFAFELLKNVESIDGDKIVVDTKLTSFVNNVMLSGPKTEVEIGVDGFDKNSDMLLVFKNGVIMVEGVDYNISENSTKILSVGETWNQSNVEDFGITFVVFKEIAIYDAENSGITMGMLGSDVRNTINGLLSITEVNAANIDKNTEAISKIDLSKYATKEDLSNYATKEDLENVEVDLSPYQEKNSNSLATSAKDIVGAINEVFQSGNNVKQNLVDALIAKGVSCSTSDSFSKLISLIYGLTNDTGSGDDTGNENLPSFEGENTWASCVGMKVNRYALSAAAVDKKIYTFGGYNSTYCNNVEVYDTELGTWETKKSMNKSLAYTCAEAVGTNIYVFGGSNKYEECSVEEDYYLKADVTLRVYDTLTDTWTTNGSIKALSYSEPAGLSSTVIGEDIYYAGGAGESSFHFTIYKYTPRTNTYTLIGDQYGGQANFVYTHSALCASNGKLYEMGGRTVESSAVSAPLGDTICSIYDPSNPSAEANAGPELPRSMHSMGYATVNDKIYLIGGAYGVGNYYSSDEWGTGTTVLDKVYELNTYTNKWTEVSTMITPRYGTATAVVDNVIYIIGGANSKGTPLNTVEAYCPPGVEPPTFSSGASSVGLNIITATELPSEVVNNQIVLISNIDPTAVEIKDNSLCNPSVEGMVNVGTTSTNNGKYCTIAKDNITVLLYLIRALQYVNGSVKQLSAYVGIDGSWVQFSWAGLYAFISGAYENSNLFGTFKNAATSSTLYSAYPPEISGNTVKIGQTSCSRSYDDSGDYKGNALYYFTNKINCANYSKIKITVSNYSKTNVSIGHVYFGIKQTNDSSFTSSTDKYVEIQNTGTYEVDLSSYNSTGYIAAYIFSNSYSSTKSCTAYVYISSIELIP